MSPPTETARFVLLSEGPGRRLGVAGEIDLCTAPDLDRFLARHLDAVPEGGELAVDLAEVRLLAAAGVHVLERVAAAAGARRVRLVLDPVPKAVARVLELCAVDVRRTP